MRRLASTSSSPETLRMACSGMRIVVGSSTLQSSMIPSNKAIHSITSLWRITQRWESTSYPASDEFEEAGAPNTSFLNGLYLGRVCNDEILPYRGRYASGEEVDLLESVTKALETCSSPQPGNMDSPPKEVEALVQTADIAKELGGLGLSICAQAHLYEKLASCGFHKYAMRRQSESMSRTILRFFGNENQIQQMLPTIASGKAHVQLAIMEPDALYEFGQGSTTASRSASSEKECFVLTGTKLLVSESDAFSRDLRPSETSNHDNATHYLVFAKMETLSADTNVDDSMQQRSPVVQERLTALLVDATLNGITRVCSDGKVLVHFKNVEVTGESIIGVAGAGLRTFLFARYTTCVLFSAVLLGYMRSLLPRTDGMQRLLAAKLYGCEASLYLVAGNIDKGVPDFIREAISVKLLMTNLLAQFQHSLRHDAMPQAHQLLGCYKTLHEHGENHLLSLYAATLGCEDFALQLAGASTLQVMQSRAFKSLGLVERIFPNSRVNLLPKALQRCAADLERDVGLFADIIERAVVKDGVKLLKRQCFLTECSHVAATVLTRAACLSRIVQLKENAQISDAYKKDTSWDIILSELYCTLEADTFAAFHERCKLGTFLLAENSSAKISQDILSSLKKKTELS